MSRLPKAERLHGRKTIRILFEQGTWFHAAPFKVIWMLREAPLVPAVRFGIVVPKKICKLAHERNRIKRLVRESYRLSSSGLKESYLKTGKGLDFFLIYTGKIQPVYADISDKIILILKRLDESNKSTSRNVPDISDKNI